METKYSTIENTYNGIAMLKVEGAQIRFKNFSGVGSEFNTPGNRNFQLIIEDPMFADIVARNGYNIKEHPSTDPNDPPYWTLQCNVGYKAVPPVINVYEGDRCTSLTEETVGILDGARIQYIDLLINGNAWEKLGKTGVKAWIREMHAVLEPMVFAGRDYSKMGGF